MSEACITLTGLEATGFHGVFDHERAKGQRFVVDVTLWGPLDTESDDLSGTVDYSRISAAVSDIITGPAVNLIETLAGRIADRVLAEQKVDAVEVTVHKPNAPLAETFRDVSVTLTRRRTDAVRT